MAGRPNLRPPSALPQPQAEAEESPHLSLESPCLSPLGSSLETLPEQISVFEVPASPSTRNLPPSSSLFGLLAAARSEAATVFDTPSARLQYAESRPRGTYQSPDSELQIETLSFAVETRKGRKDILENVSANVRSGEVLAVIGGSGAGKTTLLDNVALEPRRGKRSGRILFNGREMDRGLFRSACAYVAQSDACYPSLTVLETLHFAASLYQGREQREIRRDRVKRLLEEVGLDGCQHVKVGDGAIIRGVSGGQRRRLSLAVELLKRPSLLVLDEPTSGLDSKAAEAIVELLTGIATANNLAIMCTIHQPSSYVFQLFDRLLVLATGRVCFFGRAGDALAHFERIGYPSQPGVNPAEFLMRVTNADFGSDEQVKIICNAWATAAQEAVPSLVATPRSSPPPTVQKGRGAPYAKQVWKLVLRSVRNNSRDPMAFGGRILMTSCMVAFVSLAYLGARERNQDNVLNYMWAVMWVQQLPAFLCIGAVPSFLREHLCYQKEVKNGLYHPVAHFVAENMVTVPFYFVLALASLLPATAILDMTFDMSFWLLLACYIGFNDTVAQFCGTFGGSTAMGTMLFLMQTILNMIFNGTLLSSPEDEIWALRWLFYVVPSKYTFRSGVRLEFEGLVFSGYEECSDPLLPAAARAVMPCWGSDGHDVVAALGGQMFPVLTAEDTYATDLSVVLLELVLLKLLHMLILLQGYYGCFTCCSRRGYYGCFTCCVRRVPAIASERSRQLVLTPVTPGTPEAPGPEEHRQGQNETEFKSEASGHR
eukprot:CAMPEP_0115058150 /NCGR_PEP_ID=MMETSP0227-20121206/6177_1 /TAXON_ID=89957 /ORGANISM="Polarella glacialis, Strain CCMP 1383" /LENGTH=768 /DNA_ID=CAMNT_0002443079 /DNA_START=169 /DNA_END=2471 /DNA_ORIENTATION=-